MGNLELCEMALKAIAEARAAEHNVLTADISLKGLSEWHVPVVEQVVFDVQIVGRDGQPVGGDIYLQAKNEDERKRRYAISRQGLSKLAVAAGIIWSANETRRTDNRACRDYVSFQAVGGLQKPDGTYTFMKAEYDLDMEVVEEEMIGQKKKEWEIKKEMIQKRKHKLKLCESGAKDRVIRELLGIKATYPLEQIKKPFVILRITVRPDYNDADVKRAMLGAMIQNMAGIYGGAPAQQIGYEEPIDVTPEPVDPPLPPSDPPPPAQEPGSQPEPKTEDHDPWAGQNASDPETDFKNSSPEDQIKILEAMMKRKGYDQSRLKKPLQKFDGYERVGFFTHLNSLQDRKEAA